MIGPSDARYFSTGNSVPQSSVIIWPHTRQQLLDALGTFDAEARRRYQKTFLQLTGAEQDALLAAAASASPESALHQRYMAARNWVLGAYYSTEAGIRGLSWTNHPFFPSYPNCPTT